MEKLIKNGDKVKFIRKQEISGRIMVDFICPDGIKHLLKSVSDDDLRPAMKNLYLDNKMHCIVATDGWILQATAVQIRGLEKDAEDGYQIPAQVFKKVKAGDHILVRKDGENIFVNGIKTYNKPAYPKWLSVIPENYPAERCVLFEKGTWKNIQKAIKIYIVHHLMVLGNREKER